MEFTAQMRKEIKKEQKKKVIENYPRIMGAFFLATVPVLILTFISALNSINQINFMMNNTFASGSYTSSYDSLITIVQILISAPITYGLMQFLICIMRDQDCSAFQVIHVLTHPRSLLNSLKIAFVLYLRRVMWMIVPMLVMSGLLVIMLTDIMIMQETLNGVLLIIGVILLAILLILIEIKISTYNATYMYLNDNEKMSAWQASFFAGQNFKGRFLELVKFYFSFAPWYIVFAILATLAFAPFFLIIMTTGGEFTTNAIMGLAISIIIVFVIEVLFGSFMSAYVSMSFFSMYEKIAPAPQGIEFMFNANMNGNMNNNMYGNYGGNMHGNTNGNANENFNNNAETQQTEQENSNNQDIGCEEQRREENNENDENR